MDFRQVTNLFADPDFDGDPVQIYEPDPDEVLKLPEINEAEKIYALPIDQIKISEAKETPRKYYVNNVQVSVLNERIQYYDKNGKLITESLKDFSKKSIKKEYSSLNNFIQKWNSTDKKSVIIDELTNQGVLLHELKKEVGKEFDEFDLICHVAFDKKPLTRKERANNVKKRNYFTNYGEKAKAVLNALLDKYADEGLENIEDISVLKVNPFTKFGTPIEIIRAFGGKEKYHDALIELEQELYA